MDDVAGVKRGEADGLHLLAVGGRRRGVDGLGAVLGARVNVLPSIAVMVPPPPGPCGPPGPPRAPLGPWPCGPAAVPVDPELGVVVELLVVELLVVELPAAAETPVTAAKASPTARPLIATRRAPRDRGRPSVVRVGRVGDGVSFMSGNLRIAGENTQAIR